MAPDGEAGGSRRGSPVTRGFKDKAHTLEAMADQLRPL